MHKYKFDHICRFVAIRNDKTVKIYINKIKNILYSHIYSI